MALKAKHKETVFGIGDRVRITSKVKESGKLRSQVFEGMVIAIKGSGGGKSFTVRRIGESQVGIERIFPLLSPTIENINVVRSGVRGVRRAKLYYTREQHKKEIDLIYSRAAKKELHKKRVKSKISSKEGNNAPKK